MVHFAPSNKAGSTPFFKHLADSGFAMLQLLHQLMNIPIRIMQFLGAFLREPLVFVLPFLPLIFSRRHHNLNRHSRFQCWKGSFDFIKDCTFVLITFCDEVWESCYCFFRITELLYKRLHRSLACEFAHFEWSWPSLDFRHLFHIFIYDHIYLVLLFDILNWTDHS